MTMTPDEFRTLIDDVASALGDGWSHEATDENIRYGFTHLAGPNGARLSIGHDRYRSGGKLEISGAYPDNQVYGLPTIKIGVGETRGAAVIAKEISRRVLPDYLVELERVVADNARRGANADARRVLATELAAVVGGRIDGDDRSARTSVRTYRSGSISFEIDYDGTSGSVEASSLTVDQLHAIAAILAV